MKSGLAQVQDFNYRQPREQAECFPQGLLQYRTLQEPVLWAGRGLAHGRKAFTVVKLKTENMSALPERMTRSLKGKQIPRLVILPS